MADKYGKQIGEALGLGPNERVSAQSEGEINNPHHHSGQTSGEKHVDAHDISTDGQGNVSSQKLHSDDR